MAEKNVKNVLRVDGSLYLNPTQPDNPAGLGTPLGDHEGVVITIGDTTVSVTNKLSGHISEEYVTVRTAVISVFQRSFDADMLSFIFPGVYTKSTNQSQKPRISDVMGVSGSRLSSSAGRLLFLPREPDRHPGLLMYNAVAFVDQGNDMEHEIDEDWGMTVVFKALPDESRRVFEYGFVQDFPTFP